jgi:aminopeptidase N
MEIRHQDIFGETRAQWHNKMKRFASILLASCLAFCAYGAPVKHNYDLTHVLWRLSVNMAKQTIAGDVTNTLTLTEDSQTVELHCSELEVSKVWVDGKAAQFTNREDKLTVTLPALGTSGQTLAVRTVYTGTPVNGFLFVKAENAFPAKTPIVYTQGQGEDNHYWLPTYDLPDDKATSESYVTVPLDWTAVANGAVLGIEKGSGVHTYHSKMDQPHSTYLISLVAGPLVEVKDKWRTTPVSFFVPPGLVEEGKASFGSTPKMIQYFSKLTGVDYPYAKFAQEAVPDFMYGGMENITAVTQTARTLHRPDTEPVNSSINLVAHELAHQWFGDLITCRTWEHSWLNEGFATTLPMFLRGDWYGKDYFDLDRYGNLEGAVDTIGSRGRKDIATEIGSAKEVTVGSVYDGGCSRIMLLYRMLGDDTFWRAIKQFLTEYGYKPSTTEDFFKVFEEVSGKELDGFVKQWYYTSATPSLIAKLDGDTLVVNQLQPYYTLDLPVWIWANGVWVQKDFKVAGKESRLDLGDLAGKPMLLDPEAWIPMELQYDIAFTPQDVAAMYAHAPNVAQKARIVRFLFDTIPVAQRIGIGHTEKFEGLLQMIATHIPAEGSSYLLELSRNDDPRVVRAAIVQMGNLAKDAALVIRAQEVAKNHKNEAVRESAMQSLLNWSSDPALARRVWGMRAFDDGYRVMALDWFSKRAPGECREKALAFIAKPDGEYVRTKAAQVLGVVKEKAGERRVYDALIAIARENSYRTRLAAITSLGQLGNNNAIEVLMPFTTHGPGGVRGAAQTAIDLLKKS